jgi:urease accessory protein
VRVFVTEVLGGGETPRFAGRRVTRVPVAWDEASRRRLRREAEDGTDVVIELQSGEYLADGAVLHDDGERILAVHRPPELALVVRLDARLPPRALVAQALALGHAFGNQHVPIDIEDGEARIPLTTSEAIARATVAGLELQGAVVEVAEVALGRRRPLPVGSAHIPSHPEGS